MAKIRNKRVMIRFVPGKGAAPDEVRFSPAELTAVRKAQKEAGYAGISTFIRELAVKVAGGEIGGDDYAAVKKASEACALPLGEWLRLVVLGALAFTPLEHHMWTARHVLEKSLRKVEG